MKKKAKSVRNRTINEVDFGDGRSEEDFGDGRNEEEDSDNEEECESDKEIDENEDFNGAGNEIVPVNEDGALILANEFGDYFCEDELESEDSGDEMLKDDKVPDKWSSSEEDEDEKENAEQEDSRNGEEIVLGKTFCSAAEFKLALLRYSLKTGFDIKLYKSTQKRMGAICSDRNCSWRVYCSYEKSKHKMQIKVCDNTHICSKSGYSKLLKTSTIAQLYKDILRADPKFTAVGTKDEILKNFNLRVSIGQCRKVKSRIMRELRRRHEEHFARIWDYEAELHRTNKGTIVDIETTPGAIPGHLQRFYRMYISFEAQRIAWKSYCRPIIGLDGAFLKWDVKRQLLTAVGRDGDNRIVPIAWAVVEIENVDNWDWFVNHLKVDLALDDGKEYTIISDKQKGLVKAVQLQLPAAEHRMCARHILCNWKRDSHDIELERIFWKIARSYTVGEYLGNLEALKQYSVGAHEALMKLNPETWSRAFFKVSSCCNDNLNNLCESFNRTIRESRRKPLLDLLEDIRRQCMVRTARRCVISHRLRTRFTRSAHVAIDTAIQRSRDCTRYISTGDMHEVEVHGCAYRVEMRSRTCGCGRWQLNGIPCEHAASVILGKRHNVEDYVSDFFTTRNWQHTYERGIEPVQGMMLWPRTNRLPVLPPPNRIGRSGRPSNYARRKGQNECTSKGSKTKLGRRHRVMTCSRCQEEGHNKTTCSNEQVEPPAKRPRGRPRKIETSQVGASQAGSSQVLFSEDISSQVVSSHVGWPHD